MIRAKRQGRIGNRNQQNLGSQKIDRNDIAENKTLKSKYLKSSRSTTSKHIYSAESGRDQEIKTSDALKGGMRSGAKTCRIGILGKKLLATHAQLFPVELRDIPTPLSQKTEVQSLQNQNSGFRSRGRSSAEGMLRCHPNNMIKGTSTISRMRKDLPNALPSLFHLLNPQTAGCKIHKSQR